ncbi:MULTISPECIES: tRNA 2-thiouridine(34) synthase MnmA [unclassified Nitratiruptor]|uniref:tRNA 2-thiouridine(34) synthase MnmA n=1 Tax=unclassified Nitratiruptor TaxID=2624044 RepID=UPI001916BFDA|nr:MULTISPECIES: tRNA 2-thiouridine(34) synthase MnmA [unclassified Nitratiruptor]BCD59774.1 tRNA-uridine 2-sulfurtransferase [Nitratiruptor sp. YY08-10]BCD63698.1 tRNA-uridine 2-sulfurtransferase [Nitratiruptor sp. YY08-14]
MSKKIVVAMSGGVDSSFTAHLLQTKGYEVIGVYMKFHPREEYHQKNIANIEKVAKHLGIEYHLLDRTKEFQERVYQPFVDGYVAGLTPNPCAMCNRVMKFTELIEFADRLGVEKVATGHYAKTDGKFIYEATDKSKDQSYFLFNLKKEFLPRIIFPLGDWHKEDVKKEAMKIPLLKSIAEQKESSEICFVETNYIDVLKEHTEVEMPGEVVDTHGKVIGEHKGYMHYTIGKRKGFRLFKAHQPHYVLDIIPHKNRIVVGTKEQLEKRQIILRGLNMFLDQKEFDCYIKIRYRTHKVPCHVKIDGSVASVTLKEPVYGVAKGQAGVFYDEEKVLGGGWIV